MSNDRDSRASEPVSTCQEPGRSPIIKTGTVLSLSITELRGFMLWAVVKLQECKILFHLLLNRCCLPWALISFYEVCRSSLTHNPPALLLYSEWGWVSLQALGVFLGVQCESYWYYHSYILRHWHIKRPSHCSLRPCKPPDLVLPLPVIFHAMSEMKGAFKY